LQKKSLKLKRKKTPFEKGLEVEMGTSTGNYSKLHAGAVPDPWKALHGVGVTGPAGSTQHIADSEEEGSYRDPSWTGGR